MSYSAPFLRLVAIGTLYTNETFSYSMSLVTDGVGPVPAPETVPAALVDAFEEFHDVDGPFHQQCALTTLKLNLIGEDGKYVNSDTVLYDYPAPVTGPATILVAPQIAYAVSLRTDVARGRAHAGRFYLPSPTLDVAANGAITAPSLSDVRGSVQTLLAAVQNAIPGYRLGVVSDLGTGAQNYVTTIAFGQVLDTIRSRRASLAENYVETPLLAPV